MDKNKGYFLAIFSAVLWGFSGNITEFIYKISPIDVISLVTVRMFLAGIILISASILLNGFKDIKYIFTNFNYFIKLIVFSIFGVVLTQFPFFNTIKYSSAPFATLMQFLTPILIIIYVSTINKVKLKNIEIILTLIAFIGVFLVLTNGSFTSLNISIKAIFWGILAAIGFAFYLIYSKNFENINKISLCGLSMVVGSLFIFPLINIKLLIISISNYKFIIALFLNIVVGTVLPFYMFLISLNYIPPRTTSLLQCFEPLTAILISYLFFENSLGYYQLLGGIIIILTVMILTNIKEKNDRDIS